MKIKVKTLILALMMLFISANAFAWKSKAHKGTTQNAIEFMAQSDNIDHRIAYRFLKSSGLLDAVVHKKPASYYNSEFERLKNEHGVNTYEELEALLNANYENSLSDTLYYLNSSFANLNLRNISFG